MLDDEQSVVRNVSLISEEKSYTYGTRLNMKISEYVIHSYLILSFNYTEHDHKAPGR